MYLTILEQSTKFKKNIFKTIAIFLCFNNKIKSKYEVKSGNLLCLFQYFK